MAGWLLVSGTLLLWFTPSQVPSTSSLLNRHPLP